MANFNKVFLMGNLTRDPEIRYSSGGGGGGGGGGREGGGGGGAICKFGLAVNRVWRNQAGEKQEDTCFVDIVVFGRQAETCNEYLRKGRPVFLDGRLNYNQWEDRETGQKRNKLEVVAENVQFLGSREGGPAPAGGGGGRREDSGPRPNHDESSAPAAAPPARAGKAAEEVHFDDIPF